MTASAREGAASKLPSGRTVGGRYAIESVLGEGATGVVYRAIDRQTDDPVALKVIHRHLCSDRQIYRRFQREAEIVKRLEGPHLVRLLDSVQEDDLLMIALEYVEATPLDAHLSEHGPLDLAEALEIALQICAALGVAHAAGVVHRDLKPANVLLEKTARPGSIHVRVVDFGLAKVVHGEKMCTGLTEQDMIFGTPEYMAPEQARGDEVDARCDIYSAGVLLYEMVVGDVPFRGKTPIAAMTAHLTQQVPPPRSRRTDGAISPALEAVMLRALAKVPDDRYPTARAFAEALAGVRSEPRVIAPSRAASAELGISDTDLALSTSAIGHSPTIPVDSDALRAAAEAARAAAAREESQRSEAPPTVPSPATPVPPASSDAPPAPDTSPTPAWLWTVVAVVALATGVIIGVLVGTR